MTDSSADELKTNVQYIMDRAIDLFQQELSRFGPDQIPPPYLLATLSDGTTGVVPIDVGRQPSGRFGETDYLICHFTVKALQPISYVLVLDVRTDTKPAKYAFHCCGGFPGWDVASVVTYRFAKGQSKRVHRWPNKDNTVTREYHYTVIPNLFAEPDLSRFDQQQIEALEFGGRAYADAILHGHKHRAQSDSADTSQLH